MFLLIKHNSIRTVKDAWNTLYKLNTKLSPYQDYAYCSMVQKYSLRLKKRRLKNVIYELRDEHGQPIMLIPLHLKRIKKKTLAYLWGEFSQSGHLDFIYSDKIQNEAFLTAFKLISNDIRNIKFVFNHIQEQSKLNEILQTIFPLSHHTLGKTTCVQIPIFASYNKYINSLGKQVRQNLRTSFNRLKTDNRTYEVKTFVNQPIPSNILIQLFKLYYNRHSAKKYRIGLKRFLPMFLRIPINPTTIALKKLTNTFYSIVYIDKKIAGFCAGFSYRNEKIILPFLAIDSIFSRYSPGGILITEAIKFLTENHNYKYFDLSRGDERYKFMYGGIEHYNYHYEIYPAGENE